LKTKESKNKFYKRKVFREKGVLDAIMYIKVYTEEDRLVVMNIVDEDGLNWRSGNDIIDKYHEQRKAIDKRDMFSINKEHNKFVLCVSSIKPERTPVLTAKEFAELRGKDCAEEVKMAKRKLFLNEI